MRLAAQGDLSFVPGRFFMTTGIFSFSGSDVIVYFLWKRTPHGSIRVSYDGMADFIRRFLTRKSRFCSFVLEDGETALMTLVLSSKDGVFESKVENRLNAVMKPLGIASSVIWSSQGSPEEEWCEIRSALYRSPWAWMVLSSAVALVFLAGWRGLFWTAFWGTSAWFLAKGAAFLLSRQRAFVPFADRR